MRLTFKVAEQETSATASDEDKVATSGNVIMEGDRTAVNVPRYEEYPIEKEDLTDQVQKSTKLSDFHSYLYPMRDIVEVDSNSVEHEKRSENYANEVIKQASVMHSSATTFNSDSSSTLTFYLSALLMAALQLRFR
jgi:hypothetical protein